MEKFVKAYVSESQVRRAVLDSQQLLKSSNVDMALDIEKIVKEELEREVWLNDKYQVSIRRGVQLSKDWPETIHLSIKRIDKAPIHDWRDLQNIKNELVGYEHEAVEIYPAESRLVDTANQYHLWVFASAETRLPLGFGFRLTTSESIGNAVQRPRE